MTKGTDTKRRIIDAAEEVVLHHGVGKLTLETTAAQAGLSKGGIPYHYPSRDALVAGMVERFIEEVDQNIADEVGTSTDPGTFARAYIRATLAPGGLQRERENRLGAALIAAVAAEPELLLPLQLAFDRWQARVEADGLDPAVATVVRLAADGLWLCELFGLAAPSETLRSAVGTELERLATGH